MATSKLGRCVSASWFGLPESMQTSCARRESFSTGIESGAWGDGLPRASHPGYASLVPLKIVLVLLIAGLAGVGGARAEPVPVLPQDLRWASPPGNAAVQ